MIEHFQKFYTSWNISGQKDDYNERYSITFSPKEPFNKIIDINISTIREEEDEVTSDEVESRAEILDL